LRKTHTQILKKWKLIEKAIHFQKISATEILHISERDQTSLVPASIFRRKTTVLVQQLATNNNNNNNNVENNKDSPLYDLYVRICDFNDKLIIFKT
jgi:hypothetical protein